jgi:ABC-type multidrug transport system ATPase subunit/pSer/pThr/pTyr-binding forkhead associated (FHA) protein
VYCQAPLNRPDARFCTRCGRPQPDPAPAKATVAALPNQGATLEVREGANAPRTITLGATPQTLGRAPDNAIVLESRFVSGYHARIEPHGQAHRIIDVGSTNGLLYAGRRIAAHDLSDGDVLRIGDEATGNFVSLTYRNAAVARTPQAGQVAHRYPINPSDPQVTIGRDGCDVILDNPQVSRFHAQIDRAADGSALLRDAGSTNGTFVNGQRLSAPHALQTGDVIQIGPFKLVYTPTSLAEYDQRGALRIDARGLRRTVAGGRVILHDVALSIAPREFVAVVGGSGSGKSTLIKALCGYAPADSGQVLVNGDDFYRNFDAYRSVLGYVPQDDILHRSLPVGRALDYAARLRLPGDTAPQEIRQRIARVLDDVEMTAQRDTLVEQLSGGQRKRVSIGAELLADPSLFFLDEPTSGLDPGLEKKMMYTLRRLADAGRTVILVTHATTNITQCDHVIFMAAGRVVYFGPPNEALSFFQVTSGDFADIYTKLESGDREAIIQRDLTTEHAQWQATAPAGSTPSLAELWELKYRNSAHYRRYVADRLAEAPAGPSVGEPGGRSAGRARGSPLRQFRILTRRYLDLTLQDRRNLLILLLQAPLIALLLLLVAQSDTLIGATGAGLIPRGEAKKVLFMLATVSVWFGIINAAREITKELPIFRRERLVNLRIGPYLLSKVVVLGLLALVQTGLLMGVVLLNIHFPGDTGVLLNPLAEVFITLALTAGAGTALGLVISAFASSSDRAISTVPLALIPQILFAGLIFTIEGPATPLAWLTASHWAMHALGVSLDLNSLCNLPNLDDQGGISAACSPGILVGEAAFTHTPEQLLTRWAALVAYGVVCLALTAWTLQRRQRQI